MNDATVMAGPDARGDFFRQLQQLTTRIHATRNVDEIMLDLSEGICALFAADRLTIYTVGEDKASLVSKVKTGMASFRQLRLPISAQSVAGYAALARRLLNLTDVYDAAELQRYAADLRFQQGVDRRTGYRTTQMLVVPIMHDDVMREGEVIGVFQLINNLRGGPFDSTVVEGARYLCDTLAIAFAQRRQEARRERTGFVGALGSKALGREQVEQAVEQARAQGRDVEDVLLDDFKLKLPVVGRALADHFAVPYLAFHPGRRVPADLLDGMERAAAEVRQWLPVERNEHALYVVCIDPERVKADNAVPTLFPQSRPVFCVTTRRDFAAMLDQYFGAAAPPATLAPAHADKLLDTVAALVAGSHREGLSDLRIETAPGDKPGEIRFTVSGILRLP
jgi:GAF domain-containing protein